MCVLHTKVNPFKYLRNLLAVTKIKEVKAYVD